MRSLSTTGDTEEKRTKPKRISPQCPPCPLWCEVLLLHGRADQIAPLGPRAVVVLHVRETQEMHEGEPGEARSLADAAVRDDRLIALDALRRVQRLQVVKALEGAIVV